MTALHPQFVTDPDGKRLLVPLPLAEYETLIERLEGVEDLEDARQALGEDERALWVGLSLSGLAGAYGEDEPDDGPAAVRHRRAAACDAHA